MWNLGFPGGWDGKESAHSEEDPGRLSSWVRKIPWRREWQPTPIFLPGESHGQRNLAGYSPSGRKEWDTTEQLTLTYMQSKTRHKWIHLQNRKRLTDTENRLWLPRGWAVWGRGMDWEFGVSGCGVFIVNWRIIASQCYIGFCCTTMWVSYKHIHIPSLWSLPPSPPSCPSRSSTEHRAELPASHLFHTWQCQCCSLNSSHPRNIVFMLHRVQTKGKPCWLPQ